MHHGKHTADPRLSQVSMALLTVATLALAPSVPSCAKGNARLCKWCLIPPTAIFQEILHNPHLIHPVFLEEKSNAMVRGPMWNHVSDPTKVK